MKGLQKSLIVLNCALLVCSIHTLAREARMKRLNWTLLALNVVLGLGVTTALTAEGGPGEPTAYCGPGRCSEVGCIMKAYDENGAWLATFFADTWEEVHQQCSDFVAGYPYP